MDTPMADRFRSVRREDAVTPSTRNAITAVTVLASTATGLGACLLMAAFFGGNSFVFLAASLLPVSFFGGLWIAHILGRRLFPVEVRAILHVSQSDVTVRFPLDEEGSRYREVRIENGSLDGRLADPETLLVVAPDGEEYRLPRRYLRDAEEAAGEASEAEFHLELDDGALALKPAA